MHQPKAVDALAFLDAHLPGTLETQGLVHTARLGDSGVYKCGSRCRDMPVFKTVS